MPCISLIVAMDKRGLIGRDNGLPWHLPNDLRHFKEVTMGKPILMGRKSYESIGRPLPGRQNIVLTRDSQWQADGVDVTTSLEDALALAGTAEEVMVIGGAEVYALALPMAKRLYLTRIDAEFEGDTWFPALDLKQWDEIRSEVQQPDVKNPWRHRFITLERRR